MQRKRKVVMTLSKEQKALIIKIEQKKAEKQRDERGLAYLRELTAGIKSHYLEDLIKEGN